MAETVRSGQGARFALIGGAVGAVTLLVVIAIDGATRSGYDAWHHGVSQLTRGELGWLERSAYVLCGLLILAAAIGAARALRPGAGSPLLGGTTPRTPGKIRADAGRRA